MTLTWVYGLALVLAQDTTAAPDGAAAAGGQPGVTSFPAASFAAARPNMAFDMIARLPGFAFDGGESLRGFGGTAGNVLIDGQRPSTKTDSLEGILRRIPASSVLRIDLIRGGTPGIDMQGRTVVANIVLSSAARTELTATGAVNAYSDGRVSPTLQFDASRRNGEGSVSGSVRYYDEDGGEFGYGSRQVRDGAGRVLREARARLTDIDQGLEVRGNAQSPLFGGLAHLNAALDVTGTDKSERYDYRQPRDRPADATVERYRRTGGEVGMDYTIGLGPSLQGKMVVVQSLRRRTYDSRSNQNRVLSDFSQVRTSGESILRGTITYTRSADFSIEGGGEGIFNFLNGTSALTLDGRPIVLPNASVRVEERRAEGFATANWRISPRWHIEAGARVETSTISQTGDTNSAASFFFPKPRAVVTWSPSERVQVRARVEREVGQLDFADFVATANLATGVVSAGNAKLEPERRWVFEAAFERRFWGSGDVVLTLRHAALQQVIDQVPVEGFNAPGNIGNGRRETAILDLTLPLARLGMQGGLLKARGQVISSRVIDPTTGRPRPISEDEPFSGSVTLTNDLPRLKSTWTVSLDSGYRERSYLIDEIQTIRRYPSLDAAWEYKPSAAWAVLAQVTDITRHARTRVQDIYAGLRSEAPIALTDRVRVRVPSAFYLRARRSW